MLVFWFGTKIMMMLVVIFLLILVEYGILDDLIYMRIVVKF